MHGYDGWHVGGMWLWWLLIIVAIGALIWVVAAYARRGNGGSGESPEQTLKQRFARGEIDRDQYDRMLTDLRR